MPINLGVQNLRQVEFEEFRNLESINRRTKKWNCILRNQTEGVGSTIYLCDFVLWGTVAHFSCRRDTEDLTMRIQRA